MLILCLQANGNSAFFRSIFKGIGDQIIGYLVETTDIRIPFNIRFDIQLIIQILILSQFTE